MLDCLFAEQLNDCWTDSAEPKPVFPAMHNLEAATLRAAKAKQQPQLPWLEGLLMICAHWGHCFRESNFLGKRLFTRLAASANRF